MGLLKSVEDVDVNYYEYRDTLYYNKYEYRARLNVPGIRYTYWCKTPSDLDEKLDPKYSTWGRVKKDDVDIVTKNIDSLKEVISIFNSKNKKQHQYTCRLEGQTLAIFCNDLTKLNEFKSRIGEEFMLDLTQAKTAIYSGTKFFVREPKHKYRVYFRSKRVDEKFHTDMRDMLNTQRTLYPSSALKQWLSKSHNRYGLYNFRFTSALHFIDYDDESTISYLALMYGDILGRKYKLEKRPDNV